MRRATGCLTRLRQLGQAWRLYDAVRDDAVFIDIETTGLSPRSSKITLIGALAHGEFRCFRGRADMRRAARFLRQFPLAVTFNGDAFDLRFLDAAFGSESLPPLHWDVRWALWRAGHKGPLTRVEDALGLGRSQPLSMIEGFDAVTLWSAYQRGKRKALDILVEKLRADTSSLAVLAAHAFNAHARTLPFAVDPVPIPAYTPPQPKFDRDDVLRLLPWKAPVSTEIREAIDEDPELVGRIGKKPSAARTGFWMVTFSPHLDGEEGAHGKWLVFVPRSRVDRAWAVVVGEMQAGELGRWSPQAKVSTARPSPRALRQNEHVICVYTPRGRTATNRVRAILEALRLTGKTLCFKTEAATRAGQYHRPRNK